VREWGGGGGGGGEREREEGGRGRSPEGVRRFSGPAQKWVTEL
jgi:hypothetical protein